MSRRWAGCSLALLAAGCIDFGTDTNAIGAISFDGIPYPAVVAGDTLRNEQGQVTALRATVRTGAGDSVPNAKVQFFTRDTTIQLTADGIVIGRASATGLARLFATVDGLQSITREIDVVKRPDSVFFVSAPDTMSVGAADTTNNSQPFVLRLINKASNNGIKGFLVRYTLEFRGAAIAPGDTTRILLVDDSGRPSALDTTDATGNAGRRVHVRVPALSGVTDSAVVRWRVSAGAYPSIQTEFRHVLRFRPR